jgi:hypothetical protein
VAAAIPGSSNIITASKKQSDMQPKELIQCSLSCIIVASHPTTDPPHQENHLPLVPQRQQQHMVPVTSILQ